MFGFFRKRSQSAGDIAPYMKAVVATLLRDGFQPSWLEEIFETSKAEKIGRVFAAMHKRNLTVAQSAWVIEIATDFFNKQEKRASVSGWPKPEANNPEYSAREAYFVDQLGEAAVAALKRR